MTQSRTGRQAETRRMHILRMAVVLQTALNPVIALELLAAGTWAGTGVLGPEAFAPEPFLELLAEYGEPHGVVEGDPRRT